MNLIKAYGFHKKNGGIATICLHNVPKDKASSSIIILNKKQQITKFIEKPKNRDLASVKSGFKLVNSGIYILKNSILRYRRPLVVIVHFFLIILAYIISFYIRFEFSITPAHKLVILKTLPLLILVKLLLFYLPLHTLFYNTFKCYAFNHI